MIFFKFFCQERKKILSKTMNAFLKVFPKVHFIIFYQKQVLRPNSIHQLQQSQNNNNNKLKKKIDKSDSESRTKNDFKVSSLLLETVVNQNNFKFFKHYVIIIYNIKKDKRLVQKNVQKCMASLGQLYVHSNFISQKIVSFFPLKQVDEYARQVIASGKRQTPTR